MDSTIISSNTTNSRLTELIVEFKQSISTNSSIEKQLVEITVLAQESFENQLNLGVVIPTLVEVLVHENYRMQPDLIDAAFTALLRLCRRGSTKDTTCSQNCDAVLENRGGQKLLDSLANFILEPNRVIGTACWLFMALASDSAERIRILAQENISVAMAAVLFQYSSEPYFAEMGSRAVRNLSTDDEVASLLASEGICQALVKILKESINHEVVIEQALWAIVNLSCDADISTILGSAGVFDALITIMKTHNHNVGIIEASCASMRNLTSDSSMNLSQISSNPTALPFALLLLNILRETIKSKDAVILEVVLWTCVNLTVINHINHQFCENNIIHDLKDILMLPYEDMKARFTICYAANWVLKNLLNGTLLLVRDNKVSDSTTVSIADIDNLVLILHLIESLEQYPDQHNDINCLQYLTSLFDSLSVCLKISIVLGTLQTNHCEQIITLVLRFVGKYTSADIKPIEADLVTHLSIISSSVLKSKLLTENFISKRSLLDIVTYCAKISISATSRSSVLTLACHYYRYIGDEDKLYRILSQISNNANQIVDEVNDIANVELLDLKALSIEDICEKCQLNDDNYQSIIDFIVD